jgi:ferrochelatase
MAMRYWTPSTEETAKAVERFAPDEVVLLPLYPQFSTTTTASSMKAWTRAYRGRAQVRTVCCYPELDALAEAHAQRIRQVWEAAGSPAPIRLLFSAHGLPQTVVDGGDPYQVQVEATAAAVLRKLGGSWDWRVCYQSRVGPMKWLGPYTLEALEEAGREGLGVLVSPIAFVSEHIETLVELDRDYAEAAKESGCPIYLRAPALGLQREFIEGLAVLVGKARSTSCAVASGDGWRCSGALGCCPRTLETAR